MLVLCVENESRLIGDSPKRRGELMRTLSLCLVGTSPLLLHRVARHERREEIAAPAGTEQSLLAFADAARMVMSKNEQGKPAVPVSWITDALRAGCSKVVQNGQQMSFAKVNAELRLPEGFLEVRDTDNHAPAWTPYSSVQHAGPNSQESILVIAPKFKDWMLTLLVEVEGNFPDDALLLQIFNEAGRCGIGLFHPPKKQFGQFRCSVL